MICLRRSALQHRAPWGHTLRISQLLRWEGSGKDVAISASSTDCQYARLRKPSMKGALSGLSPHVRFSCSDVAQEQGSLTSNVEKTPESPPSSQQLRRHWVNAAVPMVGFGIMDNFIMIQAGDLIDSTLGVKFGLATMTAAACGQICSDFSGVCFGGFVEAVATKVGLPQSGLSENQLRLRSVKNVGTCGAAIGVVVGCCLGMSCLLFMDLEKSERLKKQAELKTLFDAVMEHGHKTMNVQHCTLWLVETGPDGTSKNVSTRARAGSEAGDEDLRKAFKLWDIDGDGFLQLHDVQRGLGKMGRNRTESQVQALIAPYSQKVPGNLDSDEFKAMMKETILQEDIILPLRLTGLKGQAYSSKKLLNINKVTNGEAAEKPRQPGDGFYAFSGSKVQSMLMSPIIDGSNSVIGMIEMVNKMSADGKVIAFHENDEKIVEMLSVHAAIFIETTTG